MPIGQESLFRAYGFEGGLHNIPLPTIPLNRAPTNMDFGVPGQQIVNTSVTPNVMYFMAGVTGGLYNWVIIEAGGGSGTFGALVVTPGPISLTGTTTINTTGAALTTIGTGGTGAVHIGNATGNTLVTGSLTTTTTLTAGTGITATTGDITADTGGITATLGDIIAAAGVIEGVSVTATGDIAGVGGDTTMTATTVPVAGGTGAFTITSATTAGTASNAGFLKFYIGATEVFVPYYLATA